ncbi:general substrate transporter [Aspergillus pseudoustus]|uniref:General substrate transporter n=1 Tax=Aspergillus pseudoustus TaxID=1810923 RepID=A0ABR4JSF5_9EURO
MGKLIPNAFNLAVVIFVALGSTACSYGMAVIGGTIGQPSFFKSMGLAMEGEEGYGRTASYIGAFNGVNCAGSAIGALGSAWFADKYSRKSTIQGAALVLSIGAAVCAGSVNLAMFLVGRLINGLGIGALVTVIPMYQAEVSTPESRGFMVSMHGVMFSMGYSLSAWLNFGMYFISQKGTSSSFPWRFPIAFQMIPALLLLAGSPLLPYSPRWLVMQDRFDEALAVIKRLHRTKEDANNILATSEFHQIKSQVELSRHQAANSNSSSLLRLLSTPSTRKRAIIAFFVMFNNQFTGILVLNNYLVLLLSALGLSGYLPLLLSAIYVLATFPGNIFCGLYVERFGRRTFTLIGLVGIVVVLSVEAALQAQFLGTSNRAAQNAAIVFLFLVATPFWSFFLDATQFIYVSEIFPTHIRSQGVAVGMAGYYLADIILLCAGPTAFNTLQWRFFLLFICYSACSAIFVYLYCPETKGRSLEEINEVFGDQLVANVEDGDKKSEVAHEEELRN